MWLVSYPDENERGNKTKGEKKKKGIIQSSLKQQYSDIQVNVVFSNSTKAIDFQILSPRDWDSALDRP